MKIKTTIAAISLLAMILNPLVSYGGEIAFYETNADFNPSKIVSDNAVTDYNSLNLEEIRDFANKQGGTLGSYIDPETKMPAYWLIWQTAQEFRINPKFILTMLQKEQSLLTDRAPTENQYNWAVGYSCYGGVCLDIYKGFSRQIRGMANKIMNGYFADLNVKSKHKKNFFCTFTKWCVGDAKETQDKQLIIPQNRATAALYTYNPYRGGTVMNGYKIGANYNFWKIWNKWFEQKVLRPTGALLKTAFEDKVYLIQNGIKRPFKNFSAFITRYSPDEITTVEPAELAQYQIGPEIKFSQYSLLKNSAGDIFLLVDDALKRIESMEVFRTLGFNPEEVETVKDEDLSGLKTGAEITLSSSFPTGALIQDASTGGVYYVLSGIKYPVFSPEIIKANWPGKKILSIRPGELAKYPKGEAVKFRDGTLIKTPESDIVYLISGGKKLPMTDEKAFLSRGYKWDKIFETSPAAVDLHPTGETLELLDTSIIKPAPAGEGLPAGDELDKLENQKPADENFDLSVNTATITSAALR